MRRLESCANAPTDVANATSLPLASRTPEPDGPIRMFALGTGPVAFVPPQPRGWSFLTYARSGTVTIRTSECLAIARDSSAVWVPDGTSFAIEARGACDLRVAYIAHQAVPRRVLSTVTLTPVLGEIFERAMLVGYLDLRIDRDARLIGVAIDELCALAAAPHASRLPLPRDVRLRGAIERVLCEPSDAPRVRELARAAGMPARTFERRFVAETGLTPRTWLRRARLHAAFAELSSGATTTQAGLEAGYASLSAFIAAYRREFGRPPGRAFIDVNYGRTSTDLI